MKIYKENIDQLTEDEYIMARKDTFGASDIAAMFGVGFQTIEQVIALKQKKYVTEEEREVGRKPNVRKGKDLEPLILQKVIERTGEDLFKPTDMYEVFPGLTVNLDAVNVSHGIPFELKYVSTFGKNAWDISNYSTKRYGIRPNEFYRNDITEHIKWWSALSGIPAYYYTQAQVQLIATGKLMGNVCALFEHDWELRIYRVYRDPYFEVELRKAVEKYAPRLMENVTTKPDY